MLPKFHVTFDCTNPVRLAAFWATALDYQVQEIPKEWLIAQNVPEEMWDSRAALVDPEGGPRFWFQRVPEPKTSKNRLHLDLRLDIGGNSPEERHANARTKAEQLIAAGATRLYEGEEYGQYWITLADPEGNEFCIG
jgi:hypothetical protein